MSERNEKIMESAEKRSKLALEMIRLIAFGERAQEEDPLVRYADPGPPEDVTLPGHKRHNWARRLLGR